MIFNSIDLRKKKKNEKYGRKLFIFDLVGLFGISTIVGYLMPILFIHTHTHTHTHTHIYIYIYIYIYMYI